MGTGFVVNEAQVNSWIAQNEENGTVLRRYLSGMDVNQRPDCSASRWVVDFTEFSESEASNFQEPYQHVRVLVYPERRKNKRKQYRDRWWQFGEPQRAMRRAISGLQEVLTIALVSKTVMPVRVPTDQVLNHKLGVFATDSYGMQAVLSSSVHQAWAIKWSSTQGEGVNYSPTDVFATFPFPVECENLRDIGVRLERTRSEVMLQRKIGLTDLYNMINSSSVSDPDIVGLRGIHSDLDVSVVAEYGWDDIALGHGFHRYRQNERWTVSSSARIEILDRLLEENFRRASLESVASVHPEEDLATLFGEWDVASNDGSIRS